MNAKLSKVAVVSDLHLGEEASVLSVYRKSETSRAKPADFQSNALEVFVEGLKFIRDEVKPEGELIDEFVILGDFFDLSLATYREAAENVEAFMRAIPKNDLVGNLLFVPGNHDHHIWDQVNEAKQICERILKLGSKGVPSRIPRVDPSPLLSQTFLNGLLPDGREMYVTYPNYILRHQSGRDFVLHHGHFLESIFTLLSEMVMPPDSLQELEAFNAPFTEFGWYFLGQAGRLGANGMLERIYEELQKGNSKPLNDVIDRVYDYFFAREKSGIGDAIVKFFLHRTVEKRVKEEARKRRASPDRGKAINDRELLQRAKSYLEDYVTQGGYGLEESEYTFIFGHTHRYGHGQVKIDGKLHALTNCGGWTVEPRDGEQRMPDTYIIFIDGNGDVGDRKVEITGEILEERQAML